VATPEKGSFNTLASAALPVERRVLAGLAELAKRAHRGRVDENSGLCAHPAWLSSVVSTLDARNGYRGQHELFRSLLGNGQPDGVMNERTSQALVAGAMGKTH
jgi:hypothetical protein